MKMPHCLEHQVVGLFLFCEKRLPGQYVNCVKQSISILSFRGPVGLRGDSLMEECALLRWLSHGRTLCSDIFQDRVQGPPDRISRRT
jgi:hypothetical protein